MGMTIDEARTALGKERKYALHENKQAFDMAIDTMRKYQKITEIVDKWHNDPRMKMTTSYYYMAKITEVLENGNDN